MAERRALVTGATSGIGAAIARHLSAGGYQVIAIGRDTDALSELKNDSAIEPVACDVRNLEQIAGLIASRDIDVLVNNAGVLSHLGPFQEIGLAEIDTMLDVNLRAPIALSHLVLKRMIDRNQGHLFFIGSSASLVPHPNLAVYSATKSGLSMFCDSLRCDLLGTNIRVTQVVPGRVETKLYRHSLGLTRAKAELYDNHAPLTPDDVAAVVMSALQAPSNVCHSRIVITPNSQAPGGSLNTTV